MAEVFKPTYTKPIPSDAKIVTRKGQRFARVKCNGQTIEAPVTDDGKMRLETECWYIRWKDADGEWQRKKGYTDRDATQAEAVKIQQRVDRQQAGTADPFEVHHARPLAEHIDGFEEHLDAKGNTDKHVLETAGKVRKIVEGCGWSRIRDITASGLENWLKDQRAGWMSAQTSNHYLRAAKQFTRWLKTDRRTGDDPLAHLSMIDVKVDRRHDRRALTDDEFARLVAAAEAGGIVEGLPGPDRAMLYIVAGWTGYRRGELASLTRRSFDLDGEPPAVTVEAAYSKRRRRDTIPLHPLVAERLRAFLDAKDLDDNTPVFVLDTPSGYPRKTALMMRKDLEAARAAWIDQAGDDQERARREKSDYLTYQDADGQFADFHANRHTFITNLGRAGVSLQNAQSLARHHDPKLTANIYTHLEVADKASAVAALPAPPVSDPAEVVLRATGTDQVNGCSSSLSIACQGCGPAGHETAQKPQQTGHKGEESRGEEEKLQVVKIQGFGTKRHGQTQVHPTGLEPVTFGSVDRCSIQLS